MQFGPMGPDWFLRRRTKGVSPKAVLVQFAPDEKAFVSADLDRTAGNHHHGGMRQSTSKPSTMRTELGFQADGGHVKDQSTGVLT
jgi:hypothetical protein